MGSNSSSAKIAVWEINWRAREAAGNPVGGSVGPGADGWMPVGDKAMGVTLERKEESRHIS